MNEIKRILLRRKELKFLLEKIRSNPAPPLDLATFILEEFLLNILNRSIINSSENSVSEAAEILALIQKIISLMKTINELQNNAQPDGSQNAPANLNDRNVSYLLDKIENELNLL